MDKTKIIELENLLIEKLYGKLSLLSSREEREGAVLSILSQPGFDSDKEVLERELKRLAGEEEKINFVNGFLSYGVLDELLKDPYVEDIIINGLNSIYIHHALQGLVSTGKRYETQKELDLFVRKLLLFSGRKELKKVVNLELPNLEGRVNIVYSPMGPQITITKTKAEPLSIIDLVKTGAFSYEVAAQLWLYVEGLSIRPANIIIAGGPGTGKTTLLNALFSFVPANERMVLIEDTLELNTYSVFDESCSRLESDEDLSLEDLVKNSLRMRPDRIVIGEVRGAEAKDMITAVNIGKYCLGTIHAANAREAILRLQNEPMNVPEILVNLVDVFIIMRRFHVKDRVYRVIDEVGETGGMEQKTILLSQVFKYDYEGQTIKSVSPSTVFRDKLAKVAGLTPRDILNDLYMRTLVLTTLAEKNIHTISDVTTFCRAYTKNPKETMATLGLDFDKIIRRRQKV